MQNPTLVLLAAISGFLAVAFGAFGAHALKTMLTPELYLVYQTAVEYQFYHTVPLLFLGLVPKSSSEKLVKWSGWAFVAGIVLFCGSLYLLALSGVRALGAITPLGGIAFLLGWGLLAYMAFLSYRR
ncbi:MAG: DUF423 domain-containing protein [Neptuniibacter sp.]|jgi:uncharacterized membrane protein YgdD (TMEM256/DUF423 family)|uniref:DUF423 domain-containing protein n=1 Tax=Neptuniibacter sp. TaxID=1962643 RepID=UPI003B5BD88F